MALSASRPLDAVFRNEPVNSALPSRASNTVVSMPIFSSAIATTGPPMPQPMTSAVLGRAAHSCHVNSLARGHGPVFHVTGHFAGSCAGRSPGSVGGISAMMKSDEDWPSRGSERRVVPLTQGGLSRRRLATKSCVSRRHRRRSISWRRRFCVSTRKTFPA